MSRPPHPHSPRSTGSEQAGVVDRLDYLPLEYADLLALQDELAVTRLGRPQLPVGAPADEADMARTFMELSALVAHVLSVYQRHYAGEAFISTAQAPSSLVRHAHRLAYEPDPGLSASGHVVLFAKERVSGTVAAGLPLASVPLGEIKSQDYETRDDVAVDAALNELVPLNARRSVTLVADAKELRLEGIGHRLRAGDVVGLTGPYWRGFIVEAAREVADEHVTIVRLDRPVGAAIDVGAGVEPLVLLAHPTRTLRPFGSSADPALFPPASIKQATSVKPTTTSPRFWYEVQRADGSGYADNDVYLSETVTHPLTDGYVLRSTGAGLVVLKVTAEVAATVTLRREVDETFTTHTVTLTPIAGGGFKSALNPVTVPHTVASHVSATVTAIQVVERSLAAVPRSIHPFPAEWFAGWTVAAPVAATEPDPAPVVQPLDLPGLLPALTPGRALVFTNRARTQTQVVSIRGAQLDRANARTRISWDPVTPTPAAGWRLGDLVILGNAARVSHGRTVHETLGGSDGVTVFQRFALKEAPLTILPGSAGGEPQLEVRVDDVLWERVPDFAASGPDDRHYRHTTDEEFMTSVVFGDGRNGAVPPSGKKNIVAVYRVGRGRAGDVEPGRLSRLKRAHPLLDRVVNLTPVAGGAEPADPEAVRTQATLRIRTFDRAVSVSDVADLALTMPGIARAAARWDQALGIVLVVATATGETPPALGAVHAFLDARRDAAVPLVLRPPRHRDVFIAVDIEPDPAFLVEVVKDAVRQSLHGEQEGAPGMFTFPARGLGQPSYLSELYARLEAIPGVIGVHVSSFDSREEGTLADVIPAATEEWLRLEPNNLTMTVASSGALRG